MRINWRGLELPNKVVCYESTPSFGKFSVEPFERGFGVTVGNSLRRVMLSSLEGSAVTKMHINGVFHEFDSIPGVMEDVTEIVLNVKSLIVRSHDDKACVIRVESNKRGVVYASQISLGTSKVDILNPDLRICELTEDVPFVLEMIVENGRGYVPKTERPIDRDRNEELGWIMLDASFSPIVKVKYEVEETRVQQKTNYDRLNFEITTDGSITPEYALTEAAKILRKHLNPFIQYDNAGAAVYVPTNAPGDGFDHEFEAKLNKPLSELNLSVRASNCLNGLGIKTVRELVEKNQDELTGVKNFGDTSLSEVKEKLTALDPRLHLNMRLNAQ